MCVRLSEEKTEEIAANTAQARTTTTASRTRLRATLGSALAAACGGAVTTSAVRTEESMGTKRPERAYPRTPVGTSLLGRPGLLRGRAGAVRFSRPRPKNRRGARTPGERQRAAP